MPNKFKDFHNVDMSKFSSLKDEDYCSFCAGFMSKMVNHNVAHKLKHKIHKESHNPNETDEQRMELLNSYFWYSQDRTKPEHLRPKKDPRLEKYLKQESERNLRKSH